MVTPSIFILVNKRERGNPVYPFCHCERPEGAWQSRGNTTGSLASLGITACFREGAWQSRGNTTGSLAKLGMTACFREGAWQSRGNTTGSLAKLGMTIIFLDLYLIRKFAGKISYFLNFLISYQNG